jgi:hypothetical protein
MMILVLAVTFGLLVLVGDAIDPEKDQRLFDSFGAPFHLVLRMAEGRVDFDGSGLDVYASDIWNSTATGRQTSAAAFLTYFYFYFLFLFITVVALNALIALMGSSYEKVMEKKISQR